MFRVEVKISNNLLKAIEWCRENISDENNIYKYVLHNYQYRNYSVEEIIEQSFVTLLNNKWTRIGSLFYFVDKKDAFTFKIMFG